MSVWPRVMSQMIYFKGWMLPDVTGVDWHDSGKVTQAALDSIKYVDCDLAIPTYCDYPFGVPPLGGTISIPTNFRVAVGATDRQPVMSKGDWPKV